MRPGLRWTTRYVRPRALGSYLAVCVLVAAWTLADPPVQPVSAVGPTTPTVRLLQFNLCSSGLARCYTGRALDKAADVIRATRPDVVTLNEVCAGDELLLKRVVADARPDGAVTSAFQAAVDRRTHGAVLCRDGRQYGIGLVMWVPTAAAVRPGGGGIYPMQADKRIEQRAWLCVTAGYTACTTHLVNNNPDVARAQCDYLLRTVIPELPADARTTVVLGGDLNLRSDARSCVPAGDHSADDGDLQHVVTTPDLAITSSRAIGMAGTTDHPGLLVTLVRAPSSAP